MKRILITGLHSYVGNAVEAYLEQYNQSAGEILYQTDKISLRDGNWRNNSWEGYDCVLPMRMFRNFRKKSKNVIMRLMPI